MAWEDTRGPAVATHDKAYGGRYRVLRFLASGAMSSVWVCRDERLDREVALKAASHLDDIARARFESEVRILANLTHPNLVRLLDSGYDDDRPFAVFELVEGHALAAELARRRLSSKETRGVGLGLARALAHIHRHGIVHRDVKPGNVFLHREGRVVLGDFGIALSADAARLTGTAVTIGTAAYMAPEQLTGEGVGPAADVYALGLVLIECLTGQRVFDGAPAEAGLARLAHDPVIPPSLPAPWPAVLRAMTARQPETRPSAADVVDMLRGRLAPTAAAPVLEAPTAVDFVRTPTAVAPPPTRAAPNRWGGRLAAAAFVAVLAGTAAGVAIVEGGNGGGSNSPSTTAPATTPGSRTGRTAPTTPTTTAPTTQPTAPTTVTTTPTTIGFTIPTLLPPGKGKHRKG